MEQVKLLRRRTTDLLANAQQNIASTHKGFFASAQENFAHAQKNLPTLSMPHFGLRGQSSPTDHGPKGTWELIDSIPALRRSAHPLGIIAGSAYIFGGELNRQIADNDMHVVRLPVSGASTDYYRIAAAADKPDEADADEHGKTASEASSDGAASDAGSNSPSFRGKGKERAIDIVRPDLGDVPAARAGHATAVIGSRILLFGGRGADGKPIEEAGRVWVFDTRTCTWSHLDPAPAVMGGAITIHPNARSDHCAAATDKPQDVASSRTATSSPPTAPRPPPSGPTTLRSRAQGWRDWAVGDTSKTGIPQDPVVGQVAETAVDEESRGYGTLFIHAGRLGNGSGSNDIWAFDVRSRMWTELPSAPGPARADTAICISKSRLFRFDGADASTGEKLGGQLDYLHLEVDVMDGKTEVAVRARDGWQTILQRPTSTYSSTATPSEPLLASPRSTSSAPKVPVDNGVHPWPCPRSGAVFEAISMGGGREVLVLALGERGTDQPPLDDVWLFQAPPQGMSAASVTAAVLQAVGRKTGEGRWARVATRPYDDDDDDDEEAGKGWAALPRGRARLASAPMTNIEDSGVLVWGGVGEDGETFGDGWVLRL